MQVDSEVYSKRDLFCNVKTWHVCLVKYVGIAIVKCKSENISVRADLHVVWLIPQTFKIIGHTVFLLPNIFFSRKRGIFPARRGM